MLSSVAGVRNCIFNDLIIRKNLAATHGGGAYLTYIADGRFKNVLFLDNTCIGEANDGPTGLGGGIYIRDVEDSLNATPPEETAFHNCQVRRNKAHRGGGIAIARQMNPFEMANCLIESNAASQGGGICTVPFLDAGGGSAIVRTCTISENLVRRPSGATPVCGAGIFVDAPSLSPLIVMQNSIVYGNRTFISGLPAQSVRNDIEGTNGLGAPSSGSISAEYSCVFLPYQPSPSPPPYFGLGMITVDPAFVNPGAGAFQLMSTSPAIDAGSDNLLSFDWTDLDGDGFTSTQVLPLDLDLASREQDILGVAATGVDAGATPGAITDMGAYERDPSATE